LPVDVFADAALSTDGAACTSILGTHVPAWVETTGHACGGNHNGSGEGDEGATVATNDGCSFGRR